MTSANHSIAYVRIVQAVCLCVVCGILVAGLWPFHDPKNEVAWLKNENGLLFGEHGSILSSGAFAAPNLKENPDCSLEIWLEPSLIDYDSTVLAFDSGADPRMPFSLRQHGDDLVVQRYIPDGQGSARRTSFQVQGVFRRAERPFLTVTSSGQSTSIYVNGVLTGVSPNFGLSRKDLTGQLIVADSTTHDSWPGKFLGLAIYHRRLTAAQVAQHYERWTTNQRPIVADGGTPAALYLFDEHSGSIVHNRIDSTTDLMVPDRYTVLRPAFLMPPWREYRPGWSYWKDVGINIAGFIPFGFCVVACFSLARNPNRPAAAAIVSGFVISLTIELLQAVISTRSSGMTDVITNTLGTALGVMFYRWSVVQVLLARTRAVFLEDRSVQDAPEGIEVGSSA